MLENLALKDVVAPQPGGIPPLAQLLTPGQPHVQSLAKPEQLFGLVQLSDGNYGFEAVKPSAIPCPKPHGAFLFVIAPGQPDRVVCGVPPQARQALENPLLAVEGHTSFGGCQPLLYAGSLLLDQGKLVRWDNSSGHYKPPAAHRFLNLTGHAQQLLPEKHFVDGANGQTGLLPLSDLDVTDAQFAERVTEMLAADMAAASLEARGYASMDGETTSTKLSNLVEGYLSKTANTA